MTDLVCELIVSLDGFARGQHSPAYYGYVEPTFGKLPDIGFDLLSTRVLDGRVLLLEYRPAGDPPYSS